MLNTEKLKINKKIYKRLKYIADNSDAVKNIDQLAEAILNRYIGDYVYSWSVRSNHLFKIIEKDRNINKIVKHGSIDIDYAKNRLKPLFSNVSVSLYHINNDFVLVSNDYILFYSMSRFISVNEIQYVLNSLNIRYDKNDLPLHFSCNGNYYECLVNIENKHKAD